MDEIHRAGGKFPELALCGTGAGETHTKIRERVTCGRCRMLQDRANVIIEP